MKELIRIFLLAATIIAIPAASCSGACDRPQQSLAALESAGVSSAKITGHSLMGCAKEFFSVTAKVMATPTLSGSLSVLQGKMRRHLLTGSTVISLTSSSTGRSQKSSNPTVMLKRVALTSCAPPQSNTCRIPG